MAGPTSVERLTLPIAYLGFLLMLLHASKVEGTLETSLDQCCALGSSWNDPARNCSNLPAVADGVPVYHHVPCRSAMRLCCLRTSRQTQCQHGKSVARHGGSCTARDVREGIEEEACCEACKLGLFAASQNHPCTFSTLSFGRPWDLAFYECCLNKGSGASNIEQETRPTCETHNPCQQTCLDTAVGVECTCYPGYTLSPDLRSCEDIDECTRGNHNCNLYTQYCQNIPGSFRCIGRTDGLQPGQELECSAGFYYNPSTGTCADVDECALNQAQCDARLQQCINTIGSYECVSTTQPRCPPGYTYSPTSNQCRDIDECRQGVDNCHRERDVCLNSQGSFICHPKGERNCPAGYKWNTVFDECQDIDECRESLHNCDAARQSCVNTVSSFTCVPKEETCDYGLRKNPRTNLCEDIDECREATHTCPSDTACVNSVGSYRCHPRAPLPDQSCDDGFRRDPLTRFCIDIDECQEREPCYIDQRCENAVGSYRCVCLEGYILDFNTKTCKDINECQVGQHNCLPSQRCDNTIGSYSCVRISSCGTGYTFNAATGECEDDDECSLGRHNCGPGYVCRNLQGSFRCEQITCPPGQTLLSDGICRLVICNQGYRTDHYGNCVDIDECTENPSICRPNQRCVNTEGSFTCHFQLSCPPGYTANEVRNFCEDVDECAQGIHECKDNQVCRNLPGRYSCECPPGFTMNYNRECEDVNECSRYRGQVCSQNSDCQNTVGSYVCVCKSGFMQANGNNRSCADIDECAQDPNLCEHNCINVWGSYQCTCKPGYTLGPNKQSCQDIDECALWEGQGNLCIGQCVNIPGSYKCTCPDGYRLAADKRTCQDINECVEKPEDCQGEDKVCLNTRGSFKCNSIDCPPDYVRDKEHKNRCKRELTCKHGDRDCLERPQTISFNYMTFPSNIRIPQSGRLDLFTMRGPRISYTTVQFDFRLVSAEAPSGVEPAAANYFYLRRNAYNEAIIALVRSIPGPQDIEIELTLRMYHNGLFGGTAAARLFIFVAEHEF